MSAFLIDSNVLLDVITEDSEWSNWSAGALRTAADSAPLVINPIVYAEVSVRYSRIEALEEALAPVFLQREAIPFEAAFLAGKAFVAYRRRGGVRRSPLPDFFIGAHAAVRGYRLLTRDGARYRDYFPELEMVSPDLAR
jgi:predicted nucleic acid-binding protein